MEAIDNVIKTEHFRLEPRLLQIGRVFVKPQHAEVMQGVADGAVGDFGAVDRGVSRILESRHNHRWNAYTRWCRRRISIRRLCRGGSTMSYRC